MYCNGTTKKAVDSEKSLLMIQSIPIFSQRSLSIQIFRMNRQKVLVVSFQHKYYELMTLEVLRLVNEKIITVNFSAIYCSTCQCVNFCEKKEEERYFPSQICSFFYQPFCFQRNFFVCALTYLCLSKLIPCLLNCSYQHVVTFLVVCEALFLEMLQQFGHEFVCQTCTRYILV